MLGLLLLEPGRLRGMHCDHRALQELRGDGAALRSAVPGQHPALGSNCSPGAPGTHTALHGDGGCGLSSLGISHPALLWGALMGWGDQRDPEEPQPEPHCRSAIQLCCDPAEWAAPCWQGQS